MIRLVLIALALAVAPTCFADELPLGSAVVTSLATTSCGPSTSLARDACLSVAITGCGAARTARVKLTIPASPTKTVLCLPGGDNGGFCESAFPLGPAVGLMEDLRDAGYVVAQPYWPTGFLGVFGNDSTTTDGPLTAMCRSATLIEALYTSAIANPSGNKLDGFGNSGGAAQLVYCVGRYGCSAYLDRVVPSAGPPHGDLTLACAGNNKAWWVSACSTYKTVPGGICQLAVSAYGTIGTGFIDASWGDSRTVCSSRVEGLELYRASACTGTTTYYLPTLGKLHFMYGDTDASESCPIGRYCASKFIAAGSATEEICSSGAAGHFIPDSADCALKIYDALTGD